MRLHTPVLLQKTVELLDPAPGKLFIDATCGFGGHTEELIKKGPKVLGIDRDPEAIEFLRKSLESRVKSQRLTLVRGNFADIRQIAKEAGFGKVDGILFDLGVSSVQLASPERGFSFTREGPLDMRMDPALGLSAADIVNNFEKRRLYEIFKNYGQEKFAWAIAGAICRARELKPIATTEELARVIEEVYKTGGVRKKHKAKKLHPATKAFLALRIVVNSELLNLEKALPQTVELLNKKGRLVVISFHSLEDGIVKRFFKHQRNFKVLTPKPIGPEKIEILANPRSRSAKMRAAEKI
ncbi:MAG TPA: 16S rRNA (cytosine(1402)-N(4))-methyltransferase RsmH [Patescibacteria group bacterium]|nr:16S rRNA (cytosine(1402)-N(4))-methyltransferase RsmH [Patescibacteria group bacterium]